jgi:hypothetical protein
MNQRLFIVLSIVSASAVAAMVGACGGDSSTSDGGNDATTGDSGGSDATNNDSGGSDGASDSSSNDSGNNCVGSDAGCRACCVAEHPDGAAVLVGTEIACACTTPGLCKNQCKSTVCAATPKQANLTCSTCIADKDAGDCRTVALTACAQNADCTALAACVLSCGDGG